MIQFSDICLSEEDFYQCLYQIIPERWDAEIQSDFLIVGSADGEWDPVVVDLDNNVAPTKDNTFEQVWVMEYLRLHASIYKWLLDEGLNRDTDRWPNFTLTEARAFLNGENTPDWMIVESLNTHHQAGLPAAIRPPAVIRTGPDTWEIPQRLELDILAGQVRYRYVDLSSASVAWVA